MPSPRVTSSSSRLRNGTTPQKRPQSRLSEPAPASDSPAQQFDDFGGGGGDDYAEPQEPESSSPARRNRSFSQIDEDEDEEPGYNTTKVLSSPNISTRTNRTAQEPSDNAGMEDEIDQGLNEVNGAEMSEEEEPVEQRVSAKAGKKRAAEEKPKKAAPKRQRTEEKRALIGMCGLENMMPSQRAKTARQNLHLMSMASVAAAGRGTVPWNGGDVRKSYTVDGTLGFQWYQSSRTSFGYQRSLQSRFTASEPRDVEGHHAAIASKLMTRIRTHMSWLCLIQRKVGTIRRIHMELSWIMSRRWK